MPHSQPSAPPAAAKEFTIRSILPQLLAIVSGAFMVLLDSTVVNVALPNLMNYFHSDLKMIQWTVTGYTLALSAIIPLAGWLSERFGAKQTFIATIILFTVGSALCAVAQTAEQLILFRVIQGLGGGMVMPLAMSMTFKLAPPEKRGAVMGVLGIPLLMAPALGPVLSGWLVDYASWHWIFLINLPIGIAALLLCFKYMRFAEKGKPPHLDYLGIILGPAAFAMLVYGVSEGGTSWSSTGAIFGMACGGVALILFVIVELKQKQPLMELRAFQSSDFTKGMLLSWVFFIVNYGAYVLLPLYLQNVKGFSPFHTGLSLMPMAFVTAIAMPMSGKLFDKIGARPLALLGMISYSIGLFILSTIQAASGYGLLLACLIPLGLGAGLILMPLNTHVLNSAPPHLVNRVTPLTASAQQIVISFAITSWIGYMTSRATEQTRLLGETSPSVHSLASAFADTFFMIAWMAVIGMVISFVLRKPKPNRNVGDEPIIHH